MILKHDRPIIGIDVDGTLRNLEAQLRRYIEKDHPNSLSAFDQNVGVQYRTLNNLPAFKNTDDIWKWMYEERVFELFALAPRLHSTIIDNLNIFTKAAKVSGFDLVISTVQRDRSVTATLQWLAKWGCKVQNILCFDSAEDKFNSGIDVFVDDSPELIQMVLDASPLNFILHPTKTTETVPRVIKVDYKFNSAFAVPSIDIVSGGFNDLYEILKIDRILYREETDEKTDIS